MKIALAQQNYIVNHFEYNKDKIVSAISQAKELGVDLVVFSELSVCGYPPHDLLDRGDFISKCIQYVNEIASHCNGIAAIVGGPSNNSKAEGKPLYNSAFFLRNGAIESIHNKSLLPTYDIFDEYRYFEPNNQYETVNLNGKRLAITVCEDLWDDQPTSAAVRRRKLYPVSPMEQLARQNPDIIINIAASPFSFDNQERRFAVFSSNVRRYNLPVVYVNQVGANTDLIFDGASMVLSSKGSLVMKLKSFTEDFQVFDTEEVPNKEIALIGLEEKYQQIHDALVLGIRDYFQKMGFNKATLGLSGGIDSALTLVLAQRAIGSDGIRVLLLPSQFSSQHSIDDAIELADRLGVRYDMVNIEEAFQTIKHNLSALFKGLKEDLTEENIQARIRGVLLMALSNKFGHLLLNTSNKSEAAVGYGTLYGDMCGALSVLGDVYKTDVYALANLINRDEEIIPINTILKPPSAELRPNQKDSDSLPDYSILDAILFHYIEGHRSAEEIIAQGFDKETVLRVTKLVNANEYKRFQSPPTLRISSKAFGFGRKMPLVAKY